MLPAILALILIYILYKLFVQGLLFWIILFCFGWFGLYIFLNVCVVGARDTAVTLGQNQHLSWAFIIPTIICIFALACKKSER